MIQGETAAGSQEDMIAEQATGLVADQHVAAAGRCLQVSRVELLGDIDQP